MGATRRLALWAILATGCGGAGAPAPPGVRPRAPAPGATGSGAADAQGPRAAGPPTPGAVGSAPDQPQAPPGPSPVLDPSPATPGWLKGQTHVHSNGSYDAHTPPDQVLRFYQERGYDFVAITDHNRVTVVEPPAGLLLVPGVELTQNATVCSPPPKPGYRCLFHVSGLFLDPARDPAGGRTFKPQFHEDRQRAYAAFVRWTEDVGGLAVVNHPLFHFALDTPGLRSLVRGGVHHVELFNASLDAQHPGGRADAERHAEALWDGVLAEGHRVFALATDDAHHFADVEARRKRGKFAYEGDRAWIQVRAPREIAAIRAAITRGDFYASTGLRFAALEVDAEGIALTLDDPPPGTLIRWMAGPGVAPERTPGPSARRTLRPGERYLRAVAEAPDGRRAWTQPVLAPP